MENAKPLSVSELNELLPRLQATIESLQCLSGEWSRPRTAAAAVKPVAAKRALRAKYGRAEGGDVRDRILNYLARAEKAKVSRIASELEV